MHCPYCRASYSVEESCFCLPWAPESNKNRVRPVDGPWGEAVADWSMIPDGTNQEVLAA
jgi:hypothetical protein